MVLYIYRWKTIEFGECQSIGIKVSQLKTNVQQIKVEKILNYKNIDLSIIKHDGNPANTKGEHPMIGLTSNYNLFTGCVFIL